MVIMYMAIICLSALLAAWVGVRVLRRLAPVLGMGTAVGGCLFVPSVLFWVVVGAPAPALVGAILLAVALAWYARRHVSPALPVVLVAASVAIGVASFAPATVPYLVKLPHALALLLAGAAWFALAFSARFMSASAPVFTYGVLASLLALGAAPLLVAATHPLALDAAIIGSACIGLLLASCAGLRVDAPSRTALGFLVAFLQVAAVWQGAWMAGLASMVIWLGAAGWVWMQHDPWGQDA